MRWLGLLLLLLPSCWAVVNITIVADREAVAGQPYKLNVSTSGQADEWIVVWGDGTLDRTPAYLPTTSLTHVFLTSSIGMTFNILVSYRNQTGTYFTNELVMSLGSPVQNTTVHFYSGCPSCAWPYQRGLGLWSSADEPLFGPNYTLYALDYSTSGGMVWKFRMDRGYRNPTRFAETPYPEHLTFLPNGGVLVVSKADNSTREYRADGSFVRRWRSHSSALPVAVKTHPNGKVYLLHVVDYGAGRGEFLEYYANGTLSRTLFLADNRDAYDFVFVNADVVVLSYGGTNGGLTAYSLVDGAELGTIIGPEALSRGLTVGPDGDFYTVHRDDGRLRRVARSTGTPSQAILVPGFVGRPETWYYTFTPSHQVLVIASRSPTNPPNPSPTHPTPSSLLTSTQDTHSTLTLVAVTNDSSSAPSSSPSSSVSNPPSSSSPSPSPNSTPFLVTNPTIQLVPGGQAWQGSVQFSGTLTVVLDPSQIQEGATYTLFTFAASSGAFSNLALEASGCEVEAELIDTGDAVLLEVLSITCTSTAATRLFPSNSLL